MNLIFYKDDNLYIKNFQKIFFYSFNTIIKLFFTIVYIRIITLTLIFHDHPLVEYPLCKSTFSQSSILSKHKMIHTVLKQYECEICKKTFSRKDSLTIYKRIHTGDRPYPFDMCEKAFSQSVLLANHKMVHTCENQNECKICKKIFSKKETLANHKRVHTGEKPYFIYCGETIKIEDIKGRIQHC